MKMNEYVTELEQELIDATAFKPGRKHRDRQAYLGELLRACSDISDDALETLSDDAYRWCHAAAMAHASGNALPDFGGDGDGEETVSKANGATEPTEAPVEVMHTVERPTDEKPKKRIGRPKGSKNKPKGHEEPVHLTAEGAKIRKQSKKAKKRAVNNTGFEQKQQVRGVNAWGVTLGTKSDIVCRMAAQQGGTTQKDIKEATGRPHYNLFNRLVRHNYEVRVEGGRVYLGGKKDS